MTKTKVAPFYLGHGVHRNIFILSSAFTQHEYTVVIISPYQDVATVA